MAIEPNPFEQAKAWRAGDTDARAAIEARITIEDRWSQFRSSSMGELIARLGERSDGGPT